tara:strand:- start:143 stop:325 length:183 start_codon:yes stop_codon:yes gene_type:complete
MKTLQVEITANEMDTLARKVEHYWVMFHPFGYDTRLVKPAYYDKDRKLWVAKITRLESCD